MIVFYLELITKILLAGEYQNICVRGSSPFQRSRLVDLYDQDLMTRKVGNAQVGWQMSCGSDSVLITEEWEIEKWVKWHIELLSIQQ